MLSIEVEKRLTRWVSFGALGITLLVTDRVSNDPVNVGKMLLLAVVAGASFALTSTKFRGGWKNNRALFIAISIFLFTSVISIFTSLNPWERGFFGAFGRNTGFLTYLSLSIVFVAVSFIRDIKNLRLMIIALVVAGIVNLVYCIVASQGHDIFQWKNPYNSILGTLGNPDFISAFLGIFTTVICGFLISSQFSKLQKFVMGILVIVAIYVIKESLALQGYIVAAAGICIVVFFYLRSVLTKTWVLTTYTALVGLGALVALMGTLQKGPLSGLLYKPSVTFRGEYWQAGINMGIHHPLTGVGMDSYGTFYRVFRASSAAVYPGVNVVTDTAHNVFIDIFAGIGILGFISYLIIIGLVLRASLKLYRERKAYDPIFVILFASWVAYQLQSFISINQIGLAVWGWLLGGSIIAYSKITDREEQLVKLYLKDKSQQKKGNNRSKLAPISAAQSLSLFAGCVLGFLVGLPPFLADVKMRQAMVTNDSEKVIAQANSWPRDVSRSNRAIVALANGGLTDRAKELSIQASIEFPADYASWFTLYELTPDGSAEKAAYKVKLHTLDPYNPEFAPK